ncbi:hypothetical protein ACS5PK_20155 [Roseateles sp. DB2]|uniref:hypothetical protein n=1 Tax=Roseateles sp. DB2 TaxID=3453717 RepID=UPI003EE9105B
MDERQQDKATVFARGQVLTLVYIALTAGSQVFLNHVGGGIPIEVALFYMSGAACLVFGAWEWRRFRANHRALLQHWRSWLTFSLAFVLNWILSYFSVTHTSAEFFVAVFFLSSALCSCLRDGRFWKAAAVMLGLLSVWWLSGFEIQLLASAMAAGGAMYVYYIGSLKFSQASGLGPISVVSMRCYLLFLCSAAYLLVHRDAGGLALERGTLLDLAVLIVANMVLPSFLSQVSLQLVGVVTFTIMNSLIPVLAFVMNSCLSGHWNLAMLASVGITTLVLNLDLLMQALRRRAGWPAQAVPGAGSR